MRNCRLKLGSLQLVRVSVCTLLDQHVCDEVLSLRDLQACEVWRDLCEAFSWRV